MIMSAALPRYPADPGLGGAAGPDGLSQSRDPLALSPAQGWRHTLHAIGDEQQHDGPKSGPHADEDAPDAPGRRSSTKAKQGVRRRSSTKAKQGVRRRISRACDQCNQLRTKCDGKQPCAHCVELHLTCEYERARKKRGKMSRRDIAARQAVAAAAGHEKDSPTRSQNDTSSPSFSSPSSSNVGRHERPSEETRGVKRRRSSAEGPRPSASRLSHSGPRAMPPGGSVTVNPLADASLPDSQPPYPAALSHHTPAMDLTTPGPGGLHDYGSMDDYHRAILNPSPAAVNGQSLLHAASSASSMLPGGSITGYGDSHYTVPSPNTQQSLSGQGFGFGSPLSAGFLRQSPMAATPPGWMSLPSPSAPIFPHAPIPASNTTLRYPVLQPILPYIDSFMPATLACDLLDIYFSGTSQAFMQSHSPYVLGQIFRKRSILRPESPRACSPALLASILWVAAQTSENALLTSPPSARGQVCQKLLDLTVGLLKPLIHTPLDGSQPYDGKSVVNGLALGGFGVALHGQARDIEGGSPGATGALDDVVTYIHLATVVSASEYKAASLRWWNAAWSLARELKLGRELPPNPNPHGANGHDLDGLANGDAAERPSRSGRRDVQAGFVSEEEREERRRIWWLLYIVDRHLALCYNRPLFLLDAECDGLLQPVNEVAWQAGEDYPTDDRAESAFFGPRGPSFECTGNSIFGFFLPLMTMLGEIVDLNQARNHPRFGIRFNSDEQVAEISRQLEAFERSLKEFEAQNADHRPPDDGTSPLSVQTSSSMAQQRISEPVLQSRIVVAYGTHLLHTLHILLNGKWDPISLLDDNDLWISSQSFVCATGHAVSAAEAINGILEYDPDLSFMPFFFGIYLLQGSFLLLLIADKLAGEASPAVVKACESIVRAHEACVVTLNTEYQRNFRKVMRSALAQVRGRLQEDFGEQQLRRREVLALYRWTGDGTGLAL